MEREPLRRVASRHLDPSDCDRTMTSIFDETTAKPRSDAQAAFYSIFGADSYRSIDLTDPRADYTADLNHPLPRSIGRYDVVTNFGTTEHVFNIAQSFASIHRLLGRRPTATHAPGLWRHRSRILQHSPMHIPGYGKSQPL
jgi:hypothetical protein